MNCRFDILPSVVMSKIETDEMGGGEMEDKMIERKKEQRLKQMDENERERQILFRIAPQSDLSLK